MMTLPSSPVIHGQQPPTEIDAPLAFADLDGIDEDDEPVTQCKERSPNMFRYEFGDYMDCNYYRKFLFPEVRDITYQKSSLHPNNSLEHSLEGV
jgi:hypothetical protein